MTHLAHPPTRTHDPSETTTTESMHWVVDVYRRLFQYAGQRQVLASSRFEAECLVDDMLDIDEWFPSCSARRASDMRSDLASTLVAAPPKHNAGNS